MYRNEIGSSFDFTNHNYQIFNATSLIPRYVPFIHLDSGGKRGELV